MIHFVAKCINVISQVKNPHVKTYQSLFDGRNERNVLFKTAHFIYALWCHTHD